MRLEEALPELLELGHGGGYVLLGAALRELDAQRGIGERLRDAVVEIAGQAMAFLLADLHDAEALGREVG